MNHRLKNTVEKDVVIAGGGLAGLTLAHQLKTTSPELDILVLERNQFPIPEKTSKVGESTVEIGSRYLNHTLGLKDHFDERHLRKHGLRCFFGAPCADFSGQDELGVSQLFGIPTYQIDRGAIENYLQSAITGLGVDVWDGVTTSNLSISAEEKSIAVKSTEKVVEVKAKWIIDAAGRQSLIKNALNLSKENDHKGNAVWFRVDRQIKLDEWSNNPEWQARTLQPNTRWLSTNHFMGPGYWVWLIPLDNGATSIGVVMDDQAFASHDFSNIESTLQWLEVNHPRCAEAIEGAEILDYVIINDYSHGCKQMFSEQGWGLTGESGVFSDPFYSPGSDSIALNNTFLHDLIQRWQKNEDIRFPSRLYQSMSQSFFDSTLSLYTAEYGGFGDRRMMALKLVWDYAYYWGVLSLLFFKSAITDIELMREMNSTLRKAQLCNQAVQARFRARAQQRIVLPSLGMFLDQYKVPCLRHFNRVLGDQSVSVAAALPSNVEMLERLAGYVGEMLQDDAVNSISDDERSLLGDYRLGVLA